MITGAAVCRHGEEQRGKDAALRGTSVDDLGICFPSFKCSFLSDRKAVIHLQEESVACSWECLSCSRGRTMVLKAEIKSKRILV